MIGQKFISKIEKFVDEEYGYTIIKPLDTGINRTLYFTSNPFLEDNEHIICCSLRDGVENLYKLNFHTGEYWQLTDEDDIHPTISYLDRKNQVLYCRTPKKIFSVNINTFEYKTILDLKQYEDKGITQLISSVAITCDGKYLITGYPFTYTHKNNDGDDLHVELYRIFKIDLETGEESDIRYTNYKVDHIQTSPTDPTYFTYCCWGYYATHQRVWGCSIDGLRGGALGNELPIEHRTHEYFTASGERMFYHGKFFKMQDGHFVKFKDTFGVMNADGSNDTVYTCPKNYKGAGHSCASVDEKIIIGDGKLNGVGKISKLYLNKETMMVDVEPIFTHRTSMTGNVNHPHPSISHNKRYVCFATDFELTQDVNFYIIDLESKK